MSDGLVSELSLVEQARRGDRAAFEQLVRNLARLLFAHLYLKTGNAHQAEDLVQETLLIAWKKVHTIDDSRNFRPWIMTIANSVFLDAVRRDSRKKRSAPREDESALEQAEDRGLTPAVRSENREERERVLAVLRSLPEEYRIVLSLRYLAGADYEAIARQLALSNGSLRGLLQRGMKILREKMRD